MLILIFSNYENVFFKFSIISDHQHYGYNRFLTIKHKALSKI